MKLKNMNKIIISIISVFIVGCTNQSYVEYSGEDYATFSLSSSQDNSPSISLMYGCGEYSIGEEKIEKRKYTEKAKNTRKIPANVPVEFDVSYNDIPKISKKLVSTGTRFTERFEQVSHLDFGSCDSHISFVPARGMHYEVYFAVHQSICRVRVIEVTTDSVSGNREYKRVNHADVKVCKNP